MNANLDQQLLRRLNRLEKRIAALERLESGSGNSGGYMDAFMSLPGLVGFWPLNGFSGTTLITDLSENELHLSIASGAAIGYDAGYAAIPYMAFDSGGGVIGKADHALFDIIGTEVLLASDLRGLTLGGWFYFDAAPGSNTNGELVIGKANAVSFNTAYEIRRRHAAVGGVIQFGIGEGTGFYTEESTLEAEEGRWWFLVGRFDPSSEVAVFMNGNKDAITISVPATLQNTSDAFTIGARGGVADPVLGGLRAALCFLCASAVPDSYLDRLFMTSRILFGV